MTRFARLALAFSIIATASLAVLPNPASADASPPPARSIDVSTSQSACHAPVPSSEGPAGATLSASANAGDRTIADMTRGASLLDASPPVVMPATASWNHGCVLWRSPTA